MNSDPYTTPRYASRPVAGDAGGVFFTDATDSSGIDFIHETGAFGEKLMPETMGSGVAIFDHDLDGRLDLFFVNSNVWPGRGPAGPPPTQRLYRNLGSGRFEDVTARVGLAISLYGMGVAGADYDGDGDTDLYLTALGPNRLMRNDDGRFTDATGEARLRGGVEDMDEHSWTTAAAWLDYDLDGWPDLFECGYVAWTPETDLFTTLDGINKSYATPEQYGGETCRLHRNTGYGGFEDVSQVAGVANPEGKTLGVAIADFNEDGWPDIAVANDTQRNFLYRNQRDGTFIDVAVRAGVAYDEIGRARAGMGIDVAEVGGHGRWTIAIGNFAQEPLSLFTRIGPDLFQDRAGPARLTRPTLRPLTFGLLFADIDLDGNLDIVVSNGHIEPDVATVRRGESFEQSPQLFLGDAAGRFADVSDGVGPAFSEPFVGRGVATADIDDDGDVDLVFTANGGRPRLLINESPPGNWLKVRLAGLHPNRDGLGAFVSVFAGGHSQRRFVTARTSYLSHSPPNPLHFGLGESSAADSVVVVWSAGGGGAGWVAVERNVLGGGTLTMRESR